MARKQLMTWVVGQRRWIKKHKGKMYAVSCKQLGRPDTKDESRDAANDWWQTREKEIEAAPPTEQDLRKPNAFRGLVDGAGLGPTRRNES